MSRNYNRKKYLIIGAIFAVWFFLPFAAKAATTVYLDLENSVIYEDDIFIVDLKITSPDKSINVIDGTILYDNSKLEIEEISTANSILALWPKPPTFSNTKGSLSFVGGVPGGFQGEKRGVLRIAFLAKNIGEAQIDFVDDFSVFLHDGKGTQIYPSSKLFSFDILERPDGILAKDKWSDLIDSDKTPPKSFEILLSRDSSIFNNQYFISFFTTDVETGVAYYKVQEGKKDFTISTSPYLLQDQSLKNLIKVTAVDNAGNERVEKLMPTTTMPFYKNTMFWIILFIIIIYDFWRKRKRKNKK